MKTMENYSKSFLRMLVVAFILTMTLPSTSQDIIRRKSSTSTSTRSSNTKQPQKKTPPRRVSYNDLSELFDSVAVSEVDVDTIAEDPSSPKVTGIMTVNMSSGFEMYGRCVLDYVDVADGQKKVRESLAECENAKTGCLSSHMAMYVYGGNGFMWNGLKDEIYSALKYCNDNKYVINDVAFTESGWWCVIYENKKYRGHIPDNLKKKLDQYVSANETLTSISISENGHYAIVTDKHVDASNEWDLDKIKMAIEKYGHVNSVCISNRGIMVTCSKGILFWDVPDKIIESLENKSLSPRVVRFTDSGTYMAFGEDGQNAYYM